MDIEDSPRNDVTPAPKVFISYSWDSDEHKAWVLAFAEALVKARIDVTLDQWHLHPGQDAIRFMEDSAANSDYVLVICTPPYAAKANDRSGAAGYETTLLTSGLVSDLGTKKFIPVLREGSWGIGGAVPRWLAARDGIDMRGDSYSSEQFGKLLRALHGKPLGPPPLGTAPDFEETGSLHETAGNRAENSLMEPVVRLLRWTGEDEALSARAQELLWNVARDAGGQIAHIKAIGGERLSVNNQMFPKQRDPRSKAEWFGALRSLTQRGLLEGVGFDPDYYRLTDQGWQVSDELTDFAIWEAAEVTLERRYIGAAEPDVLTLKCKKIVRIPAVLFDDRISVKDPKTLIVEGIDAASLRPLPFEPTHVWFIDSASNSEQWFCLYPGCEVANRALRLPVNG